MKDRSNLLISILLDTKASWADRHDAALDLGEFNEDIVVKALVQITQNPEEDNTLVTTCGESIGLIFIKNNKINESILKKLSLTAYEEACAVIQQHKPEWMKEFKLYKHRPEG